MRRCTSHFIQLKTHSFSSPLSVDGDCIEARSAESPSGRQTPSPYQDFFDKSVTRVVWFLDFATLFQMPCVHSECQDAVRCLYQGYRLMEPVIDVYAFLPHVICVAGFALYL